MGNKAKRREVTKLLKKQGLGKLYTGNKRVAWKYLSSYVLKDLEYKLQFKAGDIVNDCDCFNSRIVKWLGRRTGPQYGGVVIIDQFEKENGSWSCGCAVSPESPWSRENIEAFHRINKEDRNRLLEQGWWTDTNEKQWQALILGEHVVDENGMLYPEYQKR